MMISPNIDIPKSEAATPRTADETMWVIGEVTLIERRLAMLMRKPVAPYQQYFVSSKMQNITDRLTVIIEPQMKVIKGLMTFSGCESSSRVKKSLNIAGVSPTNTMTGINTIALKRLLYHDSKRALPFTILRLFLITTE